MHETGNNINVQSLYSCTPIYTVYVAITIILIMIKSIQCTGYAIMQICVILIVELQTLCGLMFPYM